VAVFKSDCGVLGSVEQKPKPAHERTGLETCTRLKQSLVHSGGLCFYFNPFIAC
jgi:hypothetical protein